MELNWPGVVVATAVGMVVAGVWYGKAFLTRWQALTGVMPEQSKAASRRNMTQLLIANAVTAVGLAAGIEVVWRAAGHDSSWLALLVGFGAWLAFSATTLLQHNAAGTDHLSDADFAFGNDDLRRWEQILTDHQTVLIKGAGHFVPSDAPEQFAAAIRGWHTSSL